jgi:hypothetical protein
MQKKQYKIIIEINLTASDDKEAIQRSITLANNISLFDETLLKPHLHTFEPVKITINESKL